ncbi:MAG TPA: hypothetical protein VD994_20070, partial [Prosthecobacter sp.]|nr:hypothetical protein [Prosthecobacter sp.]
MLAKRFFPSQQSPPLMPIDLETSLSDVPGLPPRVAKLLAKESVVKVADVLVTLPFRHEDRRHMESPALHAGVAPSCHQVTVTKCSK